LKAFVSLTLGVLLAVFIAACGDDNNKSSSSTTQPAAGTASQTLSVSETEFKLDPSTASVDKAGQVKIDVKNDGSIVHALEVEGPSGEFKTGDIQPGESTTLSANLSKAGTYEWYCPIGNHRQQGMEGEVTVGGSGGGTTTTDTTETNTTTTGTTETNTTETQPGDDSGGSGGSSGSGGSGGSGSGSNGTGGSGGY
jgi:plastocyanin